MRVNDIQTGIEVIPEDKCFGLVAENQVGRLAVNDGGQPVIFPVNYALDGDHVVFRTAPGTKLHSGPRAPVAFEIDRFDAETRSGWSVQILGRLEEISPTDRALWERVLALPIDPWAKGPKSHWMRVVPRRISGRRVGGRR